MLLLADRMELPNALRGSHASYHSSRLQILQDVRRSSEVAGRFLRGLEHLLKYERPRNNLC